MSARDDERSVKKRKRVQGFVADDVDQNPSKEERREAKRLRKLEENTVTAANIKGEIQSEKDEVTDSTKATKKDKKGKKAELNGASTSNEHDETAEKDRKAAKRARKEEKARLKAEKKASKQKDLLNGGGNTTASLHQDRAKDSNGNASDANSSDSQVNGTEAVEHTSRVSAHGEKKKKKKKDKDGKSDRETTAISQEIEDAVPKANEYSEDALLSALPQTTIDGFLDKKHITMRDPLIKSRPSLRPVTEFRYLPQFSIFTRKDSPFDSFKSPTPIQAAAWPHLLAGRDVIGIAETGSGKTLAFGIPCIQAVQNLQLSSKHSSPRAVIVSPTRELALQIHAQLETLASFYSLRTVCIYGGMPKEHQLPLLKKAHIIVATPGRLNDFIEEGSAKLKHVKYLILDEADRMLDTGFEDAIRQIISSCPTSSEGRQTSMFTATWPQSVRNLASTFMTSPVHITVSGSSVPDADGQLHAPKHITQVVEVIEGYYKEGRLRELIKSHSPSNKDAKPPPGTKSTHRYRHNRILIFCLYKKEAARIETMLRKTLAGSEIKVAAIHGDMSQPLRTASINMFKSGDVSILVATDVAARGLDIPDVKVVVNFTFPLTIEDYVHRIGRTGRAGKDGLAITFFTVQEKGLAGSLVNVLKDCGQDVPEDLLKFGTTVKKKANENYGSFYRERRPGEKTEGTMVRFD